jgi:ATP-dependent Clp protease ATP-binding subunit ClpX
MTEPKNSIIKQYQALFKLDDIVLNFEADAIEKIAELTIKNKTGARGLRSIIESTLQDLMFEMPSKDDVAEITITVDAVEGGKAKIINKQ